MFTNNKISREDLENKREDLEVESEYLDSEIEVKRKKIIIAKLNEAGGNGFWKHFSIDGTKAGLMKDKAMEWLRKNN